MTRKLVILSLAVCLMLLPVFSGITMAASGHLEKSYTENVSQEITLVTPEGKIDIAKKLTLGEWPLYSVKSMGPKPHSTKGELGEALSEGSRRYAIVAGISDYPGTELDIFYADDDAMAVSSILTEVYNFDEVWCFVDGDATRDAILEAIEDLKELENENDEVVFFFSGHGAKLTPATGQGQVGIVTWGSQEHYPDFIWDKELRTAFKEFETDRLIFLFDCCLAGGMINLAKTGRVACMASTQNGFAIEYGTEYSYYGLGEIYIPGVGYTWINHGLFTYLFAVSGMQLGLADFYDHDNDEITKDVTVEEAFDYTRTFLIDFSNYAPDLWLVPTIGDNFQNDLLP